MGFLEALPEIITYASKGYQGAKSAFGTGKNIFTRSKQFLQANKNPISKEKAEENWANQRVQKRMSTAVKGAGDAGKTGEGPGPKEITPQVQEQINKQKEKEKQREFSEQQKIKQQEAQRLQKEKEQQERMVQKVNRRIGGTQLPFQKVVTNPNERRQMSQQIGQEAAQETARKRQIVKKRLSQPVAKPEPTLEDKIKKAFEL